MTLDDMLKTPLDELFPEDRARLLSALLDRCLGNNVLLGEPLAGYAALIFSADDVMPKKRQGVMVRSY